MIELVIQKAQVYRNYIRMGKTSKSEILNLNPKETEAFKEANKWPYIESPVLFYHYLKKEENIDII